MPSDTADVVDIMMNVNASEVIKRWIHRHYFCLAMTFFIAIPADAFELKLDEQIPASAERITPAIHEPESISPEIILKQTQQLASESPPALLESAQQTVTQVNIKAQNGNNAQKAQTTDFEVDQLSWLNSGSDIALSGQKDAWLIFLLPIALLAMGIGWWLGGRPAKRPGSVSILSRKRRTHQKIKHEVQPQELATLPQKTEIRFTPPPMTISEPKINRVVDPMSSRKLNEDVLNRAYDLHREGRYDRVQSIFTKAFQHHPYELNVYVVALSILLESEENVPEYFWKMVQGHLQRLKESSYKEVWLEVSEYGKKMTPTLFDWA